MKITQLGGDMTIALTSRSFSSSVFTLSFRSKMFQVHVDHAADCDLGLQICGLCSKEYVTERLLSLKQ